MGRGTSARVYPRRRGGAEYGGNGVALASGLSPQARGSAGEAKALRTSGVLCPQARGSRPWPWLRAEAWVYPRRRGGAGSDTLFAKMRGVLPQAQGSPYPAEHSNAVEGSVPAGARAAKRRDRSH